MSVVRAPLAPGQEGLWLLQRLQPELVAYNTIDVVRLSGELDPRALERALARVVGCHPGLRARFVHEGGTVWQVIEDGVSLRHVEADLGVAGDDQAEVEVVAAHADRLAHEPFKLEAGGLVRSALLRADRTRHYLVLVMHHIVIDDWSFRIFWSDLASAFSAELGRGAGPAVVAPESYADALAQHRSECDASAGGEALAFWLDVFEDHDLATRLTTDHPAGHAPTFGATVLHRDVEPAAMASARGLARRIGVTPFAVMLAAWARTLAPRCTTPSVVLATPFANRLEPAVYEIVAYLANTLPLRVADEGQPLEDLAAGVGRLLLGVLDRQRTPLGAIVRAVTPRVGVTATIPLAHAGFGVDDIGELELPGLRAEFVPVPRRPAPMELALLVRQRGDGGLAVEATYWEQLFERATVDALVADWIALLASAGQPARQNSP